LIDDFYALEGLQHFSDSDDECDPEDKGEVFLEKDKVGANKEETKAMTTNECKKANIAPPPASKAPYPTGHRARSLSPKPTSSKVTKATSPNQTSKVPLSTQVAHRQATPGQGHNAPSPKQAKTKTFASVASTPKAPAKTQQTSLATQTPNKPV